MKRTTQPTDKIRNSSRSNFSVSTSSEDRLSALIATTNSDVNFTRTELFFFLGALTFIWITALGIGDRELLIGTRAKLPLLDISIDLEQFLAISPLAILATSFVLLLKFSKIKSKFVQINELLEETGKRSRRDARTYELRLTSNFITQWLIDSPEARFERRLSFLIYFCCLWVLPITCQLFIILRTLPLHSEAISLFQLITATAHLWLIAYFHAAGHHPKATATGISCLSGLLIGLIFSVPDGRFDRWGSAIWPTSVPIAGKDVYFRERQAFILTAVLLESGVDSQTRRPILWFSRNLVVRFTQPLSDNLESNSAPSASSNISLRGRNLRYAVLAGSDLRGIDLTLADLTGANLANSDLRGAKFGCVPAGDSADYFSYVKARFRWSNEKFNDDEGYTWSDIPAACTILTNVDFLGSDFRGITIESLQNTKPVLSDLRFANANLAGVDLSQTNIQRADFSGTNLSGAKLNSARAVGATFTAARLIGTNLQSVDARLANFSSSSLVATDLTSANLSGAIFLSARFRGVILTRTNFIATRFDETSIWQTDVPRDIELLSWARIGQLRFDEPQASEINYWRRSLADLQLTQKIEAELLLKAHAPGWSGNQWADLGLKFKRDDKDTSYQAAYTAYVLGHACFDVEFLYALVAIARNGLNDFWYTLPSLDELKLELPPDPAITKFPKKKPDSFTSYFPGYEIQGPVTPIWFDYRNVHKKLTMDECKSVQSMEGITLNDIGVMFYRHYDTAQKRLQRRVD